MVTLFFSPEFVVYTICFVYFLAVTTTEMFTEFKMLMICLFIQRADINLLIASMENPETGFQLLQRDPKQAILMPTPGVQNSSNGFITNNS